ncbi:MAG: phosphotransferase [Micropruina sp.]|uniref:phosphotransferase enzyme family protein n=1 Tax=Micropruina sp. TaxID=2737536 RepID=UPI0039E407D8
MISRRAQIARLRRVAVAALRHYDLPEGRLRFVSHGENTTFRLSCPDGDFLVRVHRPQRHGRDSDTPAAVASEIAWLDALRAHTELQVPRALRTPDDAATVQASAAGMTRTCSVLHWMDGRIHESSPRPAQLRLLGEAMATLHHHADSWTPPPGFTRISWDASAFFGDVMIYGETPAAQCWELLPAELRSRFDAVAERMTGVLATETDVGLIHADLHLGNALFVGGQVKLIDFDDCGTGPRLYDLAVALWELRDGERYAEFRDALLTGYLGRRPIDVARLDDYIALRQLAFDLWFTGTAQVNPAFAADLDGVHRWSLAMLDLVEGGVSGRRVRVG